MDELQPSVAPGEVRLVGGEQKSRNADRVLQIDWCETIWGVSRATGVTGVDAIEIVPLAELVEPSHAARGFSFWAIAQASRHPTAPRAGRVLSGKALVRDVTRLPSEPAPDADASHPLKASAARRSRSEPPPASALTPQSVGKARAVTHALDVVQVLSVARGTQLRWDALVIVAGVVV
jgi:hypothetical protein